MNVSEQITGLRIPCNRSDLDSVFECRLPKQIRLEHWYLLCLVCSFFSDGPPRMRDHQWEAQSGTMDMCSSGRAMEQCIPNDTYGQHGKTGNDATRPQNLQNTQGRTAHALPPRHEGAYGPIAQWLHQKPEVSQRMFLGHQQRQLWLELGDCWR